MTVIDKAKIIEAIQQTDDERILFAINRLLLIEDEKAEIPDWHKEVIEQRLKKIEEGKTTLHNWNDIKDAIFRK
jgi:hypothetical protein